MTPPRQLLLAASTAFSFVWPLSAGAQPLSSFSNGALSFAAPSTSALCVDGECQPAITNAVYFGRPAYRLTNGKAEAVVVPALGRVMRYGKVGGPNLLWNSPTFAGINWGWKNYGGDKTWLSPQSSWQLFHGKDTWPPDTAFDGTAHSAEVLTGGKLRMVSKVSPLIGIAIERTMWFNEAGEFVIQQTAIKSSGAPVRAGLWSISQAVPAQSIFVPVAPDSAYKNGFFWFAGKGTNPQSPTVANGMLRVDPKPGGGGVKLGIDAPVASLASVRDGVAWVQRSSKPKGQYPDGADGAGFPVELYFSGDPKVSYAELELLGPVVKMVKGQKSTHTVKWSLHDLPSRNVDDPQTQNAIVGLLG